MKTHKFEMEIGPNSSGVAKIDGVPIECVAVTVRARVGRPTRIRLELDAHAKISAEAKEEFILRRPPDEEPLHFA